jgi:cyanophycinase-like exopeptidase
VFSFEGYKLLAESKIFQQRLRRERKRRAIKQSRRRNELSIADFYSRVSKTSAVETVEIAADRNFGEAQEEIVAAYLYQATSITGWRRMISVGS